MPELPDIELYVDHLARRLVGETLERARVGNPFLVRSFEPKLDSVHGKKVVSVERIGKRVVIGVEGHLFLVFHLMIAGRFRWKEPGAPLQKKLGLAAFDFAKGTLVLTEAGTKRRASLYVVKGREGLAPHDPGGVDPMKCNLAAFRAALLRESHTLKRALTDPHAFSGIGNAYSDEILHAARLSPVRLVGKLDDAEIARLFEATRGTLDLWKKRLKDETGDAFPEKVTAFREGMAVHGRFGKPCPVCGTAVQRIVHAENEANYCARCQTGGKLLADRALSRLLKGDWPKSLDELDERAGFTRQKG